MSAQPDTTPSRPSYQPPPEIAQSPAWFRLQEQQAYYSSAANRHQTHYRNIKLSLIALSASIPLVALWDQPWAKYLVGLSGVAIAVLEGVLLLNQYGPLGIKYRATSEKLKRERSLMLSDAEDYADKPLADKLRLLAERVEAAISEENRAWTEAQQKALEALAQTRQWAQTQVEEAMARRPGAPAAAVGAAGAAAAAAGAALAEERAAGGADAPAGPAAGESPGPGEAGVAGEAAAGEPPADAPTPRMP